MKKIFLLIAFVTLIFSQEIFACECAENHPFLTAIKNENTKLIAKVKVRRYLTYFDSPHGDTHVTSIEVEIEEIYKGKEERKKIIINGSSGWQCLEYLSQFSINGAYLIAVSEATNSEYNLSNCGEYWLSIRNGDAHGRIAEGVETMRLENLKNEIQKTQSSQSILSFNFAENFFIQNKCEL